MLRNKDRLEAMGQAKLHSNCNNFTQYVGWKGAQILQIPCTQFHYSFDDFSKVPVSS